MRSFPAFETVKPERLSRMRSHSRVSEENVRSLFILFLHLVSQRIRLFRNDIHGIVGFLRYTLFDFIVKIPGLRERPFQKIEYCGAEGLHRFKERGSFLLLPHL